MKRLFCLSCILIMGSYATLLLAKNKGGSKAVLEKHQHRLESIESEIKKKEEQLSTLSHRESSVIEAMDRLDRQMDKSRDEIRQLESKKARIETSLRQQSGELVQLQSTLTQLKSQMAERIVALYRLGDTGYIRLFLSLDDWRDLAQMQHLIKRMVTSDLQLSQNYTSQTQTLLHSQADLQKNQDELKQVLSRLEQHNQTLQDHRRQQKKLLAMTRSQKSNHLKNLEELKEAAQKLQTWIDQLSKAGFRSNFENFKGALPLPVDAAIVGKFGTVIDAKFKTRMRRNGIELAAKPGQNVRAVHYGKVIYAGWFTGYGKIIIIDHGSTYFTMSAHLDRLMKKVGDAVEAGETIATAGDTGSLKGTQLYFELRQRGQVLDPMPWFNLSSKGGKS